MRALVEASGPFDILLNNAGKSMPKPLVEISEEEFDRTIAINLKSCFNYIQAVAPTMLAQGGGAIVAIAVGQEASPGGGIAPAIGSALGGPGLELAAHDLGGILRPGSRRSIRNWLGSDLGIRRANNVVSRGESTL
mgnify:CR=1 FL=1